jgi:FMN phosphatase YigB (HAD superfamily)
MSCVQRLLIWDFDGTLAYRHDPDLAWTRLLVETLDAHEPGHAVTLDSVRPYVRDGFPWDLPDPHPELCEPEPWWSFVEALLARAYEQAGLEPEKARMLAAHARRLYVDHTVGWTVAEGVEAVLGELTALGAEVWMIGDSYKADVQGAEALGVPAILVRRMHPDAARTAADLRAAAEIVKATPAPLGSRSTT